jgi:hypothetical protein
VTSINCHNPRYVLIFFLLLVFTDNEIDLIAEEKGFQSNNRLSNGNCKQQDFKEASSMDILSKGCSHQPNINEMGSHWSETLNVSRPASPTTQALMCDEQNITFGNEPASPTTQALMCEEQNTTFGNEPASPTTQALMCEEQNTICGNDYRSSFPLVSRDQDTSEINAVQENLVLTGLRQYLCAIIRRGGTNGESLIVVAFIKCVQFFTCGCNATVGHLNQQNLTI